MLFSRQLDGLPMEQKFVQQFSKSEMQKSTLLSVGNYHTGVQYYLSLLHNLKSIKTPDILNYTFYYVLLFI